MLEALCILASISSIFRLLNGLMWNLVIPDQNPYRLPMGRTSKKDQFHSSPQLQLFNLRFEKVNLNLTRHGEWCLGFNC